jgi:hypothetical protein
MMHAGHQGLLRPASHSGSVSLVYLTYPHLPHSLSQAGLSQLDTTSSADEDVMIQNATAANASRSSSPDRRLPEAPAPAATSSGGSGSGSGSGAGSLTLPAPLSSSSAPSPRYIGQPQAASGGEKEAPHVLGTVFELSDSREIGVTSRLSSELPTRAAAEAPGSGQELLVATSPRAAGSHPVAAEDYVTAGESHDAISEEELEAAGRPRPLGAILSEMTGEDELPEGAGVARGNPEEKPSDPGRGNSMPMQSVATSASTSTSIQLPGFPAPGVAREGLRGLGDGSGPQTDSA